MHYCHAAVLAVEMKFTVAGSERQRVTRRSLHQIYSSLGRRGGKGWTSRPKINPVIIDAIGGVHLREIVTNEGEGNDDVTHWSLEKAFWIRCLESKWGFVWFEQVAFPSWMEGGNFWREGNLFSFEQNLDTFVDSRKDFSIQNWIHFDKILQEFCGRQ